MTIEAALDRFGRAYARHRESEGRRYSERDLLQLPYLRSGPLARQWTARARSFDALMKHELRPARRELRRPLRVVDLGAGNGWLSYRAALEGNEAVAIDIRSDTVDGLGAAAALGRRVPGRMRCLCASFDSVPLDAAWADFAIFNASLHYSSDLVRSLAEAVRLVRPGGKLVIVDSPFYPEEQDGLAMVAEKRRTSAAIFGQYADVLLGTGSVEFLTGRRLAAASAGLGLEWKRTRVAYPFWYELRPLRAAFLRKRRPSRFDLWVADRR